MRCFSFVPETSGNYTIESYNNDGNPISYLYIYSGTFLTYDQDSGEGDNFKITYQLTAGTSYVIGAKVSSPAGSLRIKFTPPVSSDRTLAEYTYDVDGNRTALKETENQTTTNTSYTYDKNDRMLTKQVGNQTTVTYSYDANGNMTGNSAGISQTFDTRNRMTQYVSGNTTTTYTYYPNDMRKSKKVGNANTLTQVWNGDDIELELNGSQVVSNYVHGEKLICGTYGWYHYNAHGDVTTFSDSTGTVTKTYDYNAFGVEDGGSPNDNNPYRYSGEYYDKESGYTYLQARYYDAENGRFVSEDPAEDGDNWYVYCGNDPVNMIDPTGMWAEKYKGFKQRSYGFDVDFNKDFLSKWFCRVYTIDIVSKYGKWNWWRFCYTYKEMTSERMAAELYSHAVLYVVGNGLIANSKANTILNTILRCTGTKSKTIKKLTSLNAKMIYLEKNLAIIL